LRRSSGWSFRPTCACGIAYPWAVPNIAVKHAGDETVTQIPMEFAAGAL
jgi:hypothetical protein